MMEKTTRILYYIKSTKINVICENETATALLKSSSHISTLIFLYTDLSENNQRVYEMSESFLYYKTRSDCTKLCYAPSIDIDFSDSLLLIVRMFIVVPRNFDISLQNIVINIFSLQ